MISPKELSVELSRTPRGRLSYDRDCFKEQNSLEEILEEVESQNRSFKTSLIAELSSEIESLSHAHVSFTEKEAKVSSNSNNSTPILSKESSPKRKTPMINTKKRIERKSLSTTNLSSPPFVRLNRSFEMQCPSDFAVFRDAKRKSLERRIIFENFIRDEVREAEIQFGKKCKIMSEERPIFGDSALEEEKENRILAKIREDDKMKEEECKRRISILEEKIAREESAIAQARLASEPQHSEEIKDSRQVTQEPVQATIAIPKEQPISVTLPIKTETQPEPITPAPSPVVLESIEKPPVLQKSSLEKQQETNDGSEVSKRNYELFEDVDRFYLSFKSKLTGLTEKSLKFDLQKAVSTIINAICQVSKAHLKEKLQKLTFLSSGQPIVMGDTKNVNSSSHPLGMEYVKFIMAEKFISHWDEQPKSIFALSAIMAALSSQFPDFGKLLLAHFYRACPYILPYYYTQKQGESFKDYRTRCGYYYDDEGKEEDKEMFIKHMTGVIRLYTAFSIAELPQSHSDRLVHHGVGNLWRLVSSTLNLQPVNEVTAIVLCEVFEIAGHVLLDTYKEHFKSLLDLVYRQYIPRIKEVTLDGCHGSVSRLEDLFDKFRSTKTIPKPEGSLQSGFL